MKAKKESWGFDMSTIDATVHATDDFYHHVNGTWLKKNTIPKTESRWGSFTILRYNTEHQLKAIVDEVLAMKNRKKGTPEQMIADLFTSGMDMERRNKLGISPLQKYREQIASISSTKDLQKVVTTLHELGTSVLFGFSLDQDAKESTRYILYAGQAGLGMPDCDYYLKNDEESRRVRSAYVPYVRDMLQLSGMKKSVASTAAERLLAIETKLAGYWMNKVERRVIENIYHKKTLKQLSKLAPSIDWQKYLNDQGAKEVKDLIVMQPEYFVGLEKLFHEISLEDWKLYLDFHLVNDFSTALSEPFIKKSFSFYGTVLSGTKHMKPLWRRVLSVVNGALGEQLGKLYVERHFDSDSKKKMSQLVDDLFIAYEERIKNLDWMSAATKKKALNKLLMMSRKIGYPKKWKSYAGLDIRSDDYIGNLIRGAKYEQKRAIKKLKKKVDRDEWFMYPQTVNAYNAPTLNDIAFPAAILQPPFFDANADDAVNYGSIGSVIGHEMTHGFDDEGAKFDGNGNLKKWWSKKDEELFKKKGEVLVKQFNAYELHGVHVNGKLTLGENIADLGGASIAYDAYMRRLEKTGRKDIDGLTPEQRFFYSFAVFERELTRPEFLKTQMLNDPHSPGIFRINGPASNLPEFYEAFGVTPKSKLYRKPNQRAKIW